MHNCLPFVFQKMNDIWSDLFVMISINQRNNSICQTYLEKKWRKNTLNSELQIPSLCYHIWMKTGRSSGVKRHHIDLQATGVFMKRESARSGRANIRIIYRFYWKKLNVHSSLAIVKFLELDSCFWVAIKRIYFGQIWQNSLVADN